MAKRKSKESVPAQSVPACPPELREAWRQRKLVLFLGAGVSQPYGMPGWNDLVLSLLLDESARAFEEFWPHYRAPLGSWLAETFGLSAVAMARLARMYAKTRGFDDQQFREYVRDELYRFQVKPQEPTTLSAVADLLVKSEQDGNERNIPAVVTFNFDDLLEQKLDALGIKLSVVYDDTRMTENKLTIIHVHGYLPFNASIPQADIVFTEDEYHRLSFAAFHWSQMDMVSFLRNYTVLFLGLSMSDPNLRRLLDASHSRNSGTQHFVLRKEYALAPQERERARSTIAEKARLEAQKRGMKNLKKPPLALDQALDDMLRQAREYDTDMLEDMGAKSIWFESFDQIAAFLLAIPEK